MTAMVGMPVQYVQAGGDNPSPAFVSVVDGSGNVLKVFWPAGGTPQWRDSVSGLTRDDTLMTNNSWRPITFTGSVSASGSVSVSGPATINSGA